MNTLTKINLTRRSSYGRSKLRRIAWRQNEKIMPLKQLSILFLTTTLISGCAFVPELAEDQAYFEDCKTRTKSLSLAAKKLDKASCGNNDIRTCLFLKGVFIPASSLIVSGSLVLAGNTLHWLEYHGSCENGVVMKNYKKIKS